MAGPVFAGHGIAERAPLRLVVALPGRRECAQVGVFADRRDFSRRRSANREARMPDAKGARTKDVLVHIGSLRDVIVESTWFDLADD